MFSLEVQFLQYCLSGVPLQILPPMKAYHIGDPTWTKVITISRVLSLRGPRNCSLFCPLLFCLEYMLHGATLGFPETPS